MHLLIDLENLQPAADEVSAFIGSGGRAWVFHGPHQHKLLPAFQALGEEVTLVPISRTGPNALDFHLVFYLGHLTSKFPAKSFLVLSGDSGFDPMIEHARMLMFAVRRIEVLHRPTVKAPVITRIAATAVPTTTTAVKKVTAVKSPAIKAPAKTYAAPAKAPTPAAKKAAAPKASAPAKAPAVKATKAKAVDVVMQEVMKGLIAKNRPAKLKALEHLIESRFGGGKATTAQLQDVLARLAISGVVRIDDGKLTYPAG